MAPPSDDAAPPDLGRDAVPVDPALLAQMRGEVEGRIAREHGWSAWLRALPTAWRRSVTVAALAGLGALSVLGPYPPLQRVLAIALTGLAAVAMVLALRPVHRPALTRPWLVPGVALVASSAFALSLPWRGTWAPFGDADLHCFGPGLVLGLGVLVLWRLLARSGVGALAAASAAGLGANAALANRCPHQNAGHWLAGHVAVLALLVLASAALRAVARRRAAN